MTNQSTADTGTFTIATPAQIEAIRLRAINDVTRDIMARGVNLSHEQAAELGQETIGWLYGRLMLNVSTTEDGVVCVPPRFASNEDGIEMSAVRS